MKNRTPSSPRAALACIALGCGSFAAHAVTLPPALLACSRLTDDTQRLGCFDREIQTLSHAAAPSAAPVLAPATAPVLAPATAPVVAPAAAPAGGAEPPAQADTFGRPDKPKPAPGSKTREAHILWVQAGGDHPRFGLDNGQTWQQVETDDKFQAKAGDPVTLSQGLLGSYFMSAGSHAAVRVTRVK